MSECSSTPGRFDKSIKRNKICNFAYQYMTKVLSTKDKEQEIIVENGTRCIWATFGNKSKKLISNFA